MWLRVLIKEKYCHFEVRTLIKQILVGEPIPAVKPIPALKPNPVVNITPSIPIPIPTNFLEVNVIPIPKNWNYDTSTVRVFTHFPSSSKHVQNPDVLLASKSLEAGEIFHVYLVFHVDLTRQKCISQISWILFRYEI